MNKLIFYIFITFFWGFSVTAKSISVCSDKNFWYPFTFVDDKGASAGLHIDIIRASLEEAGYTEIKFKAIPWKRCLKEAEKGKVDAVATASYKDKRAKFLNYPSDAKESKKSKYRVTQVEYIVLSNANSSYEYDGNLESIPVPVRAVSGYSIVEDLVSSGLKVDSALGTEQNLKKMFRDKKGSVITIPEVAKYYSNKDGFKNKFKVSKAPIKSKSYHFVFAKKGNVSLDEAKVIWKSIEEVRENRTDEFAQKY